jgi:hypothetical protein
MSDASPTPQKRLLEAHALALQANTKALAKFSQEFSQLMMHRTTDMHPNVVSKVVEAVTNIIRLERYRLEKDTINTIEEIEFVMEAEAQTQSPTSSK